MILVTRTHIISFPLTLTLAVDHSNAKHMLHSMNLVAFAYDISCIFRDVSLILCAVPKRNTNRFCSQIMFKGSIIFLLSLFSSLFHSLPTNSWQNGINRHTIINMNMIRFFPFRHRKMLWIMICWQKTIHLLPKSSANSIELWTNFFLHSQYYSPKKPASSMPNNA